MKSKRLSCFFVLLLIITGMTGFAQKRSLTNIADEAFEAKQYVLAAEKYKDAYSKVDANRAEKNRILFRLSECYRFMNHPKKAVDVYDRLIKARYYKTEPQIFFYKGEFERFLGDFEEAEYSYKEYLKLVPNDEMTLSRLSAMKKAEEWMANPTKHVITNMKSLNTEYDEWMPKFTDPSNPSKMIFTSSREGVTTETKDVWTGEYFSDLFYSEQDRKGYWSEPMLYDTEGNINTPFHEGEADVDVKETSIYFSRCMVQKSHDLSCAIYTSSKKGRGWSAPERIILGDTVFNYLHPTLSEDKLTMYFSSDRPGGHGDYDIWKATRSSKKETKWTEITNLGKIVNSKGKEQFPILRNDTTLYFSSNGHEGLGGYDIFFTSYQNGKWSVPENLGYPLNTQYDEIGIVFYPNSSNSPAEAEQGFLSSNRKHGKGGDDIYSFYRAPLIYSIKGKVRDDLSMQLVEGAKVKLIGSDESVVETRTDRKGRYEFDSSQVKHNVNYTLTVSQVDYLNTSGKETTVGLTNSKDFVHDFRLKPMTKDPVVLPEIRYDLSQWDLKPQYEDSLTDLLLVLMNNPSFVVELRSHTDSRPFPRITNDTLSQHRAESVVNYLVARGIDRERLVPKGYAAREPRTLDRATSVTIDKKTYSFPKGVTLTDEYIANLKSVGEREAAHQLNRRTEFRIIRTDYLSNQQKDSIKALETNKEVINIVAEIEPPTVLETIPIVYDDNNVKVTMIHGKKAQINIVFNGAAVPVIYDERYPDAAVISWDLAMEFLRSGRINKNDFMMKEKAFEDNGDIIDNSVLFFRTATIGPRSWTDKYQVIVQKGLSYDMIINKNGLKDFGDFTFDKAKGEIRFE